MYIQQSVSMWGWNNDGTNHYIRITDPEMQVERMSGYKHRVMITTLRFGSVVVYSANEKIIGVLKLVAATGRVGLRVRSNALDFGNMNKQILQTIGIYNLDTGDREEVKKRAEQLMIDEIVEAAKNKLLNA